MKDTYLQIRVPATTFSWFKDYAKRRKTTMSALLRRYIAQLRGEEELANDEREASARSLAPSS